MAAGQGAQAAGERVEKLLAELRSHGGPQVAATRGRTGGLPGRAVRRGAGRDRQDPRRGRRGGRAAAGSWRPTRSWRACCWCTTCTRSTSAPGSSARRAVMPGSAHAGRGVPRRRRRGRGPRPPGARQRLRRPRTRGHRAGGRGRGAGSRPESGGRPREPAAAADNPPPRRGHDDNVSRTAEAVSPPPLRPRPLGRQPACGDSPPAVPCLRSGPAAPADRCELCGEKLGDRAPAPGGPGAAARSPAPARRAPCCSLATAAATKPCPTACCMTRARR